MIKKCLLLKYHHLKCQNPTTESPNQILINIPQSIDVMLMPEHEI